MLASPPPSSAPARRLAPALPPQVLARAFERVSDAVVCVDAAWRITYLNARAGVLAGRDPQALVGRLVWEEFPTLAGTALEAAGLRAMATGEPAVVPSTSPAWRGRMEHRLEPFPGGLLVISAILGPPVDDTPLVEQSRYLRAVLDTAPECVKVVSADGRLLDMNPAGLTMLEAPSLAALRGQSVYGLIVPEHRDAYRAAHEAALRGEGGQLQYDVATLGGRRRRFETLTAPLHDADGMITGVLGVTRDVTDARTAEDRLRESEAHFRELTEGAPLGVFLNDAGGTTIYVNQRCADILGLPREALLGVDWKDAVLHPDDAAQVTAERIAFRSSDEDRGRFEYRVRRADGGARSVVAHVVRLRGVDGRVRGFAGMMEDTTERRALEAQLWQAQKMEAVGQLAGGIAHDFNNLLTVIGGNLELARGDLAPLLPAEHASHGDLAEIAQATERAAGLVRQLLAFSRKQVVAPQAVDVNAVVRGAEQLLRRVVGDEIVLRTRLAAAPLVVRADAVQLEQVLVNLALNARDAMLTPRHGCAGTGGLFALATDAVTLDAATLDATTAHPGLPPGEYVRLVARDSGHGMDETTRAHLFEPFFTTKPVGAGTGLGLATVYGIVAQAGGVVQVESAPGAGATFTILLPCALCVDEVAAEAATSCPGPGRGTVLLAEDEPAVRATTRRILERHGYAVLEARHGADALVLWRAHRAEITAVVTDLRMPEMGGRELAARLRAEGAALPVLFVSGYSDEPAAPEDVAGESVLEKPFSRDALLGALETATRAVAEVA